jgi:type IV pilus assembly protein PilC
MTAFTYVAKDAQGNVVRSSMKAPSQTSVLADLRNRGLAVVDITSMEPPAVAAARPWQRTSGPRRRSSARRVPLTELSMFSRQLSIAVGSGMPLRDALESIVVDLEHRGLSAALHHVIYDLHNGFSFSAALSRRQKAFGSLFVALMKAAEESGSMAQTLDLMSVYLERSEQLEQKVRKSMTYPVFITVFFFVVCIVMATFVLPQFQEIFAGFDADLPAFSQAVFALNRGLLGASPWLAAGAGLLGVGLLAVRSSPKGRRIIDLAKLHVPITGRWLHKFSMARFCRNLAMMLRGGVPVAAAMQISSSISGNRVLEESLLKVRERLITGLSFSQSLGMDPAFPRLVVRMVAMGEESGQLPDVLEKVSDVYENQVEGAITVATSLFEPVVICFFGSVIMTLIMAIYMPIFTIGANVN